MCVEIYKKKQKTKNNPGTHKHIQVKIYYMCTVITCPELNRHNKMHSLCYRKVAIGSASLVSLWVQMRIH